ncbi:MAG: shikimate dehydrogenase [Paludibacteraceae bacterium]|jgi:shikimate dehydrogenase|nr:shikimate dehydrogenase [Paludibacteraceae bacterium]MBP8628255.1 shikimate dehydrogenase [Paludibacteraceae bacterium]MBP9648764.1 shikimate dehydrogenase [Paludibacteraceae bacterium]MBP9970504.1 shikimate dehydrogenase [Paludibacteraceae bacterium]HOH74576.1 shikimate dehydrogenase [Paludibacteraceae bacterium]
MKQYGVIGNPLHHSYSKAYFNEKFQEQAIDARYDNYLLPTIKDVMKVLNDTPNLCGLNVTIPYKEQVMEYLDEIDDEAKEIGAVNVIKITEKNGKRFLKGYNSDWFGFTEAIKPFLKPHHTHALILGTGGASKGILYALKKLKINTQFVSRDPSKGLTYKQLTKEILQQYTIIVNTTPVGTFPEVKHCPPIPYHFLTDKHLVYDLIYNPIRTLFLHQAETRGATTCNGWQMFLNQAHKAYVIWEGKDLITNKKHVEKI